MEISIKWIVVGIFAACGAVGWCFPFLRGVIFIQLFTIFWLFTVFMFTFYGHVYLSTPQQTPLFLIEKVEKEVRQLQDTLKEEQTNWRISTKKTHLRVIFGRTVDSQLQQLIDNILRDFVLKWLRELSHHPEPVVDKFKEHVWGGIQKLYERLQRVDAEKLIAADMTTKITQHFERIRIAQSCALELNQPPVFALAPHLMSCETEQHYLRQISELIVMFLLPRCYSLTPGSHLIREILACKVLQPAIDLVTDPDYINQKIVQYLEAQREVDAMHMRTHEYAKTFEDYIRLINTCNNVDTLKRIRYDIVTQIMQATTLQNMRRAKGIDADVVEKSGTQHNVSRQQLADAKKLKRYIGQLTIAKAECEAALNKLGWDGAFPTVESDSKTLPLDKVLESVTGRRYLSMYLETLHSQGLVGFWTAVEELRHSPRSSWHQLGAEIFYTYIRSPSAEVKVDKDTRKRMEAFLLGDKGPEVFYEVQDTVVDTIQEKYYQSFLMSDQYKALVAELATEEANINELSSERSPIEDRQLSNESVSSAESAGGLPLADHSTYARRKLGQLQERHTNKIQALAALRASLKPESPALAMLANEVERLAGEQMRLEAHLARTDTWAEHLGRWRATVHSAEVVDESKPPQFVIVVHMASAAAEAAEDEARPEQISTGWVLLRTLHEFQELHRKLRPMCAELKNLELPSNSFKFLFGKNDKNSLEKAKILIQKYLEFVLEDERLNQSEALYTFLNPSSEYLKQGDLPKKNKFSFSTLFKSTSSEATGKSSSDKDSLAHLSADEDEISMYLDGNGEAGRLGAGVKGGSGGYASEERDSIAEPLYALLSEVFDMRGVFRWLRKTLVTFVQITYGRTINRQIKETISWLFSEQMLHYYSSSALKAWWGGGALAPPPPPRSPRDVETTRVAAQQQLIASVRGALASLVGEAAAERGAHKLFYTLQNRTHNKQLFYDLFELILLEVFPELKRYYN